MLRNECGRPRSSVDATAGMLALMALVVLTVASLASGAPNKDKDQNEEPTRIYQHTYDEVFQASLDAIERMGMFVTEKDKDKGMIRGNGTYRVAPNNFDTTFDMHIETVSANPQTRVTINAHVKLHMGAYGYRHLDKKFDQDLFSEVQKVLSTYH